MEEMKWWKRMISVDDGGRTEQKESRERNDYGRWDMGLRLETISGNRSFVTLRFVCLYAIYFLWIFIVPAALPFGGVR